MDSVPALNLTLLYHDNWRYFWGGAQVCVWAAIQVLFKLESLLLKTMESLYGYSGISKETFPASSQL